MYIEVVRGLGETLVGNYAGTALRATASKLARGRAKDTEAEPQDLVSGVEVVGLPSKSFALVAGGSGGASLMFRSDSNCEDLDGFAGAGFFDSVPLVEPRKVSPLGWGEPRFLS